MESFSRGQLWNYSNGNHNPNLGLEEYEDEPTVDLPLLSGQVSAETEDPLGDPLDQQFINGVHKPEDEEEEDDEEIKVIPAEPSTSFNGISSCIHPYSLKIPRQNPPPSEDFCMSTVESTVRTYINNSLTSRKDPRCRHKFYFTVHTLLNECLQRNIIVPSELTPLWKKFDEWAASSASYRLGDHYLIQYHNRANDPDEDPPPPGRHPRHKKSSIIRNLENSVRLYVLSSNKKGLPISDDLPTRLGFYQTCHKYWNPNSEIFLDHYWNALVNRTASFYTQNGVTKQYSPPKASLQVSLPPSPSKKYKEPSLILPPPPIPSLPLLKRPPTPLKRTAATAPAPKDLDMDRLVKLSINTCLSLGKDPRFCHRFYWTIHRSLETISSLNLSLSEIDALWTKYDQWAETAYKRRELFPVTNNPNLYSDPSELPPPTKKVVLRKRPPELDQGWPQGVHNFMEKTVKGFIIAGSTRNTLLQNLKKRRLFLDSYVFFMDPKIWDESLLDYFWQKLLTETRYGANGSSQPIVSFSSTAAQTLTRLNLPVSKKLDVDRLVKECINELILLGKDPQACHTFYWTVSRCLETISSLNLDSGEINKMWKKYDGWAGKAYQNRRPLAVDQQDSHEYYSSARELPRSVGSGSGQALSQRPRLVYAKNGLRKFLETTVREFVIRKGGEVNEFRADLGERRRFFESYVNLLGPVEQEQKSRDIELVNEYWGKLLRDRMEDYKYYVELSRVVGQKMEEEERFSMDYLVKKVINERIDKGKDPRVGHTFYWTVWRCLEETKRKSLERGRVMTDGDVQMLWQQYDNLAGTAFRDRKRLEVKGEGRFYEDLEELAELGEGVLKNKGVPTVTQLYPGCPRSQALKKFLEGKIKQILGTSGFVTWKRNGVLMDWRARRQFFLEYLPHVVGMEGVEGLMEKYWVQLVTEKREKKEAKVGDGEEVPCFVID